MSDNERDLGYLDDYPDPQPAGDVMRAAVEANEAAGIPDPVPTEYDSAGRVTNKPGLFIRCHTCGGRKPMNGSVVISTAGGSGRAPRCADCSRPAR